MIDEVIYCTNKYIQGVEAKYYQKPDCKQTCRSEFMALMGLLYFIGTMKSQHTNVEQLWASDGTGIQILRAAMSYKRFLFLLRCIRFDDIDTGAERRKSDKLAAIRSIWDSFVQNCLKSYNTSEFVTIDEMLHPFRGRCSWIQYIPNKPAKYGIKIFALCDSKTYYCSNMEIYIGKQPPGPFAVENKPLDIVKRLVMPIENSNKNLTTDNWYTSFPLVVYLLEKKITFIGTVKKNKKEIHAEFLPRKHRIVGTSIFGFQKNKTLVPYVPKKNKAVVLVSSLHDKAEIDGDSGKPEVILDYNMTKGGVDTCDKMCSAYSVSQITRRWPLVLFYIMMNIAGINSTEQC
ncbi:piggyBac transposable element-derived protein 4-like [Argiope bruennichi]|uniref:piggyBac transposable element-derived protein 4-like n=1 Tax=Argiope bruennichi TaxID=94029 RepID=UPI002494E51E|nr:piggyBac transposable element-derived protein 4-like [Argiope bruennichi]